MATREQARLKTRYEGEIRPALVERFGYSSVMQAPAIQKITLNMGVGDGKQDSKVIDAATEQLATIAGQRPSVRRARKSIANFKLREGMPVGVSVTLRGQRGYEFLDRLMSVAIPRIRDFRGLNPRSFDGRGNYSMGVREQIIFPEIDYDAVDQVRGLDITITTSARSDVEAFALLEAFGFPFAQEGRPLLPGEPEPEPAAVAPAPAPAEPEADAEDTAEPEADAEDTAEPEAAAEPDDESAAEPTVDLVVEDPSGEPVGIVSGEVLVDEAGNPIGELIVEEVIVEDESGEPVAILEDVIVEDLSGNVIAEEILVEDLTEPETDTEDSTETPADGASPPEDDESVSSPDETD
jgi:large subunit ribosomal protein L5